MSWEPDRIVKCYNCGERIEVFDTDGGICTTCGRCDTHDICKKCGNQLHDVPSDEPDGYAECECVNGHRCGICV